MRLQSRRVNTSLVGKLLKDSGSSEGKGRGQVSTLRMGCRQGRTLRSACLAVLFLPLPHQLPHWWWGPEEGVGQEGLADERCPEPVSPHQRASGQHPSQRGSPTAWSSSMPFTRIWGELHTRGSADDTRYGQGRNGGAINLGVAGLMSYEYVRSGLVFPALLCRLTLSFAPSFWFILSTHMCFIYPIFDMSYRLIT